MFYFLSSRLKLFIYILIFTIAITPVFCQENAATFFGPYYRTNQYIPLLVHHQEEFSAISIENKYSRDSLVFNQEKKAEALVKITSSGTLFELINKVGDKRILNLSFRLLADEIPLAIIVGNQNLTPDVQNDKIKIVETNILPSFKTSYDMIEILLIQDSYQDTLSSQQTKAIKEWVLSGGIIIFESSLTLKKHAGLAVPLIKQSNLKKFVDLNNEQIIEELGNEVIKISNLSTVVSSGYGFIGIKPFKASELQENLIGFCDGHIKWRIRDRNNSISEKNSLKQEISKTKIILTQKVTVVYFLLFMIFSFLKTSNYLTRVTCIIATVSLIPVIMLTPTNKLDSHYYQLLEKNEGSEFALIKEEIYLRQGKIPELTINIEDSIPFYVNDNAKIVLIKNITGQYIKQTIQSIDEYVILKKTSLSQTNSFEKIKKDNNFFYYHKFPLDKVYEVSEPFVTSKLFHIEAFSKEGVITKINISQDKDPRDNYEKKSWYMASNQIFYSSKNPPETITILEGSTKIVPLEITPKLNIQKSFFTFLDISE